MHHPPIPTCIILLTLHPLVLRLQPEEQFVDGRYKEHPKYAKGSIGGVI